MSPLRPACVGAALLALVGTPAAALGQASASSYTNAMRYDAMGRVTGTIAADPDGDGALHHAAVRNSYDGAGRLIRVESGELASWQSEAVAPADWAGFTIHRTLETAYDLMGRKIRDSLREGPAGAVRTLTQYSYDAAGRFECSALRMNPATFASPPASACSPGPSGGEGPDRITRNVYDAAGQRLQLREGVGSADEAAEATWAYNLNGQIVAMIDGNGNRAELHYDGHGRQDRWTFPSPVRPSAFNDATPATALASAGSANASDYEEYGYDAAGNSISLRKRDGSTLTYAYDALNRMTAKTVPSRADLSAAQTRDVYYSYDLRNLQLSARFDGQSGEGVTNAYDGFGRVASSSTNMGGVTRTLSYAYDANGNRIGITHPDSNTFITWYDGLNRPFYVQANGLAGLAYNFYTAHGAPAYTGRPGTATVHGYDAVQRPTSRTLLFLNGNGNVVWNYGFNAAGQIGSISRDNDAFAWTGHYPVNRNYVTNGLNQYGAAGGATFLYDTNGNLISDGTHAYLYDVENRMVAGNGAALVYDPLGRLFQVTSSGGAVTRFLYDGDALVAEYNGSGTMTRRHIHWPGADLPMTTYVGPGLDVPRQLFANHQGSIVVVADSAGTPVAVNTYDEYGIPGAANSGRFQYTGQAWLDELGMYYYKSRIYSPTLGRFMQSDSVGYEGGINLYAYVNDDPINSVDPDGRDAIMLRARDGSRTLIIPVQITVRGGTPDQQAATRAAIVARANSVQTGDSNARVQVIETQTPIDGVLNHLTVGPGNDWKMCPRIGECTNRLGGDTASINSDNRDAIGGAAHDIFHFAGIQDGVNEGPRDANGERTVTLKPGYTDQDIMARRSGTQLPRSQFDEAGRNRTTRQLCEGSRGQHVRCPR